MVSAAAGDSTRPQPVSTSPTNLRVTVFIPSLHQGGAERVVVDLANGLTSRGDHVQVVTMHADRGVLREELSPLVSCDALGASSFKDAIFKLARLYDRDRPDVVLGTLYMNDIAAVIARYFSRHRPRIVAGAHNSLRHKIQFPDNRKDKHLLLPLSRLFLRRADLVVGVSKGVTDEIRELVGLKSAKTMTIYNPVYRPEIEQKAEEVVEHPWLAKDRDAPALVSVGRLVEQKGLPDLIDALRLVRNARPVRLLIVGDGPMRLALEAQVDRLGLRDDIDFVGTQSNPFKFMSRADLFVLSSHWEGLGNVVVEALAVGCAVVATDCDFGPNEILEDGRFGILADPRNPASLAAAIVAALDEPSNSPKRDREALKRRAKQFSVDNAVAKYDSAFRDLLGASAISHHDFGAGSRDLHRT